MVAFHLMYEQLIRLVILFSLPPLQELILHLQCSSFTVSIVIRLLFLCQIC
jgi:hypothetical protein